MHEELEKDEQAVVDTQGIVSQDQLDACKNRVGALEEKLRYLTADFENYRRNIEKERARWTQTAQADVLLDVLSLVDDYERALGDLDTHGLPQEFVARFKGFELIFQTLQKLLEKHNVKVMNNYDTFNPLYHEAVMQVACDDKASGSVVEVLQKGYLFNDAVLRPAKVSIAQ